MNRIIRGIVANILPALQWGVIMLSWFVVYCNHVTKFFNVDNHFTPANVAYFVGYRLGDAAVALIVAILVWVAICRFNSNRIFNKNNVYHNYSYGWFLVFGKFLGHTKCNLVGVPIYMQIKLILRDTFQDYHCGLILEKKENEKIKVKVINADKDTNEINLVIADTYPIKNKQLVTSKSQLYTIKISRDNKNDKNRYKSIEMIKEVVNQLRNISGKINRLNVFMTTNPDNTREIVEKAFKLHDRGNIDSIYVYQQSCDGERLFIDKEILVYRK